MNTTYAAGLFDGEGYVCILKNRRKSGTVCIRPMCGISMTYEPVIRMICEQFGGHVVVLKRRDPTHRTPYQWQLCGRQAAEFLKIILPHLIVKREEAQIAIELQDDIDLWKSTTRKYSKRKGLALEAEAVLLARHRFYDRIMSIKHRRRPTRKLIPMNNGMENPLVQ